MRRRWAADLMLYVPAFMIAFVIWLIAKQGDTETRMVAAPVQVVGVPDNVEARVVPTSMVEVNLIFPKTFLKNVLEPGRIRVALKPEGIETKAGVGTYRSIVYPLLPGMVVTGDLPPSVRVLGVVPESVTVEARLYTIEAVVSPRVFGEPAPGYELAEVRSTPAKVELTGPPAALAQLRSPSGREEVRTAKADISGQASSVSVAVALELPPGVRGLDSSASPPRVEVTASIREKLVTQVFRDVPIVYKPLRTNLDVIVQPPTTTVTVKGPRSKIATLTRDSFRFMPNTVPNEAPGASNIISFRMELIGENRGDDMVVETEMRTVTLLFEEKSRPTPPSGASSAPLRPAEPGPSSRSSDTPTSPGSPPPESSSTPK